MLKDPPPGYEQLSSSHSRIDKPNRRQPKARRLNLSDVDWYGMRSAGSIDKDACQRHSILLLSDVALRKPG
jgi:hypothetical protein